MLLLQSKKMSRSHSAKQQRMKNDEQNYVYIFLYTTYICFVVGAFCVVRDSESQFCTECVRWAFFVWRSINGGRNFRSDSSMPSLLSIWHAMCFANGAQVRSCTTTTVIAYMLILQSIACMTDVGIFFSRNLRWRRLVVAVVPKMVFFAACYISCIAFWVMRKNVMRYMEVRCTLWVIQRGIAGSG